MASFLFLVLYIIIAAKYLLLLLLNNISIAEEFNIF